MNLCIKIATIIDIATYEIVIMVSKKILSVPPLLLSPENESPRLNTLRTWTNKYSTT